MKNLKIVVPMAGLGSRFSSQGYSDPKPLIRFLGKPMIQHVIEHVGLMQHEHIFLCQKEHVEKYKLHELFASFLPNFKIVEVDGLTQGAACTVMMANTVLSPDDSILLVNSDQLTHWDRDVLDQFETNNYGGCIFCFPGEGPKWSYAKVNLQGLVTEVAEKVQISDHATSGMYFWKRWQDFMDAAQAMIAANDRTNNEFYVAPVYNYAIDKKITIEYVYHVDQVGTPEELNEYLEQKANAHQTDGE